MSLLRKTVFGRAKFRQNTFIGGVAATLSTPALLAAQLSNVSEQDIRMFEIRGNDIRCCITRDYNLRQDCFSGVYATYFSDKEGKVISSIGAHPFRISISNQNNPLKFIDLKSVTKVDRDFLRAATSVLRSVRLDSLVSFVDLTRSFTSMNNCKLYIPSLQVIGSPSVNDNIFNGSTNSTIYAHPFLATCNAGQPDADLVAAIAAGNTVVYVQNQTKPARITDLSIGLKTSTTAQILFTNPSSTNTLQEFEVSIDEIFYQMITASGQYITGLTSGIEYKNVTVKAIDIYYNRAAENSNYVNLTL